MNAQDDVRRVVVYRAESKHLMASALVAIVLALFVLAFLAPGPDFAALLWMLAGFAAIGLGIALWQFVQAGTPALVLAPEGIFFRIGRSRALRIPWSKVEGVDAFEHVHRVGLRQHRHRNVMVVVPVAFRDRHLARYWRWRSLPRNDFIGIELNPARFSVPADQLLDPVRARWHAFRDEPSNEHEFEAGFGRGAIHFSGRAALEDFRHRAPLRYGRRVIPLLDGAAITLGLAACLILLANIGGYWETGGQKRARLESEERAARHRASDEAGGNLQREWEERDEAMRELMRRAFGR